MSATVLKKCSSCGKEDLVERSVKGVNGQLVTVNACMECDRGMCPHCGEKAGLLLVPDPRGAKRKCEHCAKLLSHRLKRKA